MCYSTRTIPLCAGYATHAENEIKEYLGWKFYSDAFGDDHYVVEGLWKVVAKIGIDWLETHNNSDGCPDYYTNIVYEELFKGQCYDWSELKQIWRQLKRL
jgi:hypothetical protein